MMRFLFINHMQNAYQSLQSNRVRSALTMLGVTIGVASVTAILALSGGADKIISNQINSLGGNIIIVRPGASVDPINKITNAHPNQDYATSTLTETDVELLRNVPHVNAVAPLMSLSGTIKADSDAPTGSKVLATSSQLSAISDLKLREGQFIDGIIDQNSVVVGKQLSIDIFGSESSIGRTLQFRGQTFIVIGVLKQLNNPINYNSVDFDNAAIIRFDVGKKLNENVTQIQQIDIRADSVQNLKQAIKNIDATLNKSHDGENDYSVLSGDQISQPTSQLFYTIARFTTAVAAISLVVGGIGIMNIMLVTVTERTREIGIRKALGASNNDVLWQFLIESLAISICGGILGYFSGYIVAYSISGLLAFQPVINWQIFIIAIIISMIMGTLFGLYPAIRAARKDPIESLNRHN